MVEEVDRLRRPMIVRLLESELLCRKAVMLCQNWYWVCLKKISRLKSIVFILV